MGKTQLDYMEYANDAAAQAAYVSNDPIGSDIFTGGAASASLETEAASGAFDDVWDDAHRWIAAAAAPQWLKYDLGVGVTKTITKYRFMAYVGDANGHPTAWTFYGSNNDSDWDTLDTQTGISWSPNTEIKTFLIPNTTAYRYYKWNFTAFSGGGFIVITEMEGMEGNLQCYSEDTIKEQGSYSLKGVAYITNSLNDTLTRTVDPTINLTDLTQIKFDIRGSRIGSHIKIGIHDSGGTTTEHTANIASANVWQTETWDISGVSNANKNAIDQIIITIVNADATNVFYIDNMYAEIHIFEYVGTGPFSYSGSGICQYEKSEWEYVGSGNFVFNGTGICSIGFTYVGSGSLIYSGEATQIHSRYYLYTGSGELAFSGEAIVTIGFTSVGSGTYNFSGVGLYSLGLFYVGTGEFVYSGSGVAQVYTRYYLYEGSGVFNYSGEAVHRYRVDFTEPKKTTLTYTEPQKTEPTYTEPQKGTTNFVEPSKEALRLC